MNISGYDILAQLGKGGMGEVLLARRRGAHGFEKLLAIKVTRAEGQEEEAQRVAFKDEARLLAQLQHPAIAQVFDFGEADQVPYLVMEYVSGVPFHQVVSGPWPPVIAAKVMAEVCRGLHAAHGLTSLAGRPLGVVHRDIKPANLLLSFQGSVKIIDFGIAKSQGRETPDTETGMLKGTLYYMSPEQLFGNGVIDAKTDIYSAGVVLYELLTGVRPYTGTNPVMLAEALRRGQPAPPSIVVPSVPSDFDVVTLQAVANRPEERFASAKEMASALEQLVVAAGGADLEDFAADRLAGIRDQTQQWLRNLTTAPASGPPPPANEARPLATASSVILMDEVEAAKPATASDILIETGTETGDPELAAELRQTRESQATPPPAVVAADVRQHPPPAAPEPEPEPELEPEPGLELEPEFELPPRPSRLRLVVATLVIGGLVFAAAYFAARATGDLEGPLGVAPDVPAEPSVSNSVSKKDTGERGAEELEGLEEKRDLNDAPSGTRTVEDVFEEPQSVEEAFTEPPRKRRKKARR